MVRTLYIYLFLGFFSFDALSAITTDFNFHIGRGESRIELAPNYTRSYHFIETGSYFEAGDPQLPIYGGALVAYRTYSVSQNPHGFKSMNALIIGPNLVGWVKLKAIDLYLRLTYAYGRLNASSTSGSSTLKYEYSLMGFHHHLGLKKEITNDLKVFLEYRLGTEKIKIVKRTRDGEEWNTNDVNPFEFIDAGVVIMGLGYIIPL